MSVGDAPVQFGWPIGQLCVYAEADRAARQIGYAIDGITGIVIPEWDASKQVIGDIEGDPISHDMDTGKIYYSLHGTVRRHIKWHRLWARLRETLLIPLVDI